MRNSPDAQWPLMEGQDLDAFIAWLKPILFDPKVDAKRVNKSSGIDKITNSAGNFYEGRNGKRSH